MAIVKLAKDGYGQVELNNAAFRRDGRIEAQCALDTTDFPADGSVVAENGMLLAVDRVTRTVKLATATLAATQLIGLNYSAEHLYHPVHRGLKDFALTSKDFLPRIGYFAAGDKFTTNTLCFDNGTYADLDAIKDELEASEPAMIYAGIASDGSGYWQAVASKPQAGPVGQIIEVTTMPDGQPAVKIQVLEA